jgi:hypothetical protein
MKKSQNNFNSVSAMATIGSGLVFIGHGVLAALQDQELVMLFGQSLRQFGAEIYDVTVADLTQYIGIFDILIGIILLALGICFLVSNPRAQRLSHSPFTLVFLGWAVFQQFFTSAALIVATAHIFPGFWILLERSPSFILPLVAITLLLASREAKYNQ